MTDQNIENSPATNNHSDELRRSAVLAMARSIAYVSPVIATFAMDGMSVREAHAYTMDQSTTAI